MWIVRGNPIVVTTQTWSAAIFVKGHRKRKFRPIAASRVAPYRQRVALKQLFNTYGLGPDDPSVTHSRWRRKKLYQNHALSEV
jgi:hypothetical protein